MSSRPFCCPHCRKPLGTLQDWHYRGQRHTRLKLNREVQQTEQVRTGWRLKCRCGAWCRISDGVTIQIP